MGVEIERKFLVVSDAWRREAHGSLRIAQGYLANTARSSVRVRLAGEHATLSVKSMTRNLTRAEFEYPVPVADAEAMLAGLCEGPQLQKVRHLVAVGSHTFEVDEFEGANAGLVVAELELEAPDEPYPRPAWLGDEVTEEIRYYNFRLVEVPFQAWPAAAREGARRGRHVAWD